MKLLIAYHSFPDADKNAGALRLLEIVRILREEGHKITFLATQAGEPSYRAALEGLGVECVCDVDAGLSANASHTRRFLQENTFEVAVLCHFFTYNHYARWFRAFLPSCRLIFDTVDIHFLRLQREAELYPERCAEAAEVRRLETAALQDADTVWVVTEKEQKTLTGLLSDKVKPFHIIPTIHAPTESAPPFADRSGIVFLGSYKHEPNLDAAYFFMREVLPPLREMLPGVPVTFAGPYPPDDLRAEGERHQDVTVTGFVQDHRALLMKSRVGIAPLRFGAGMKGKIGEYLACGLPCVTTSIGAEGMGLATDAEALIADAPEEFAHAVASCYQDEALWRRLSDAGCRYVRQHYSPEAIRQAVALAVQVDAPRVRPAPRRFRGLTPKYTLELAGKFVSALRVGGLTELQARVRGWLSRA